LLSNFVRLYLEIISQDLKRFRKIRLTERLKSFGT